MWETNVTRKFSKRELGRFSKHGQWFYIISVEQKSVVIFITDRVSGQLSPFSQMLSSETDVPHQGLLARGECLDGRLQMYLTALRGVFIIGPPEPRLLRRLNREWEDPPMIGYTGPIRCLRLYRTVILPRYILPARSILISTTSFYFLDHNTLHTPWLISQQKINTRNKIDVRVSRYIED